MSDTPAPAAPPPLPVAVLGYAPRERWPLRPHAGKWCALAAAGAFFGWMFSATSVWQWRLAEAVCLSGATLLAVTWATGVVAWPGSLRLGFLAASVLVSLTGLLCYGWANDANTHAKGAAELIVLPGWSIVFSVLACAWLPAFVVAARRGWAQFATPQARRDVVPFVIAIGVLFSVAHLLTFGLGAAIGGSPEYVRGISTADGSVRASLRRSHWLGETHYHLFLTDPSPAPPFGRRLYLHGTDLAALATATTADLQTLPGHGAVGLYADGVPVAAFDPATGEAKPLPGHTRRRRR